MRLEPSAVTRKLIGAGLAVMEATTGDDLNAHFETLSYALTGSQERLGQAVVHLEEWKDWRANYEGLNQSALHSNRCGVPGGLECVASRAYIRSTARRIRCPISNRVGSRRQLHAPNRYDRATAVEPRAPIKDRSHRSSGSGRRSRSSRSQRAPRVAGDRLPASVLDAALLHGGGPAPERAVSPLRRTVVLVTEKIQLVVQGDDFGMCHAVNEGVTRAFADGILTQSSTMVACPWFYEAAHLGKELGIPLGIHRRSPRVGQLLWPPITAAPADGETAVPSHVERRRTAWRSTRHRRTDRQADRFLPPVSNHDFACTWGSSRGRVPQVSKRYGVPFLYRDSRPR